MKGVHWKSEYNLDSDKIQFGMCWITAFLYFQQLQQLQQLLIEVFQFLLFLQLDTLRYISQFCLASYNIVISLRGLLSSHSLLFSIELLLLQSSASSMLILAQLQTLTISMYSHIFGHLSSFLLLPCSRLLLQACKDEQRHGNEANVYLLSCHVQCYIQQYIYTTSGGNV